MLSLFQLRKISPDLDRSFRAPLYPYAPLLALAIAVICLIAMVYYNPLIAAIFVGFMVAGFIYFQATKLQRSNAPHDALLAGSLVR
jgi:ethanolamine permease